jgi:hypothetical protein
MGTNLFKHDGRYVTWSRPRADTRRSRRRQTFCRVLEVFAKSIVDRRKKSDVRIEEYGSGKITVVLLYGDSPIRNR